MTATGRIFQISRFAINDGDGIRTTVFLCGCPLRCRWCHNPEGLGADGGKETSVAELLPTLLADKPFYETSGGGVTLSGGEPTLQSEFCAELLRALKKENVNTAIETCGMSKSETFARIAEVADTVLFDCKLLDKEKLFLYTRGDLETILKNLETLEITKKPVILRCPVIPSVNDDESHLAAVARLADNKRCIKEVHLLPYHDFGISKYEGLPYDVYKYDPISAERGREISDFMRRRCGKKVLYCD